MAIVCPEAVREQIEPVKQLISNYQIPTKLLPADAGRIFDVPFEVLKYDVLSDGAICS